MQRIAALMVGGMITASLLSMLFYHDWGTCPVGSSQTTVITVALRRLICRLLVATVVFAQLATAAHACASLSQAATAPMTDSRVVVAAIYATPLDGDGRSVDAGSDVNRGDCGVASGNMADSTSSSVCDAHCQGAQLRVDTTSAASIPMALWAGSYPLPSLYDRPAQRDLPVTLLAPPEAADPPHTLLHCCLRL